MIAKKIRMWCVLCRKHPTSGKDIIAEGTLSATKNQAIRAFVRNSGMEWDEWRQKYGYVCEQVEVTINTIDV